MRKIDLKVPTGWNQCTKEQLEAVAGIILRRTMMQDRYHPYDPVQMKAEAFFALAGLTVLDKRTEETEGQSGGQVLGSTDRNEPVPMTTRDGEEGFMVEFIDRRPWFIRAIRAIRGQK